MAKYNEVTDPTIHQAEADIVVLTTRTKLWHKRPADNQVSASLLLPTPSYHLENPDHQSMPPKNTKSISKKQSSMKIKIQQSNGEYRRYSQDYLSY